MLPRKSRYEIPGGYSLVPPLPPEALGRRPPSRGRTPDSPRTLPHVPRMSDPLKKLIRDALRGVAQTPEVKRFRGSVSGAASPEDPGARASRYGPGSPPELPRVAVPDELFGGDDDDNESAGDGADWYDDEDEPGVVPHRVGTGSGVWKIVNSIAEPKYFSAGLGATTLSNIWTDVIPSLNPSVSTDVSGRIGNVIRVQRLQVNLFFYRSLNVASGDTVRIVLLRDRQAHTTPSWGDVFTGANDAVFYFIRPDSRGRFDVMFDESYDLDRPYISTVAESNVKTVRLDMALDDPYMFSDAGFVPNSVRYRLFAVSLRADGATGILGAVMMTYVDV